MSFNWQTFKTRAFTAIIFVVVMLAGLLINSWTFLILFSIIHFGCWWEYQQMIGKIDTEYAAINPFHRYGVIIAGWAILLYFTSDDLRMGSLPVHSIGWALGLVFAFALPIIEILFSKQFRLRNILISALGLLYISISWSLMMDMHSWNATWLGSTGKTLSMGFFLPLLLIFSIWINDTMAYLVGSFLGRTPFSKISPKKTWEGTIGGMVLSVTLICLLAYVIGFPVADAGMIAVIAAIAGTMGDLLESKLKRVAGIKDSGNLLPGHGGFMDRFDSLLMATPFVWLYMTLFMK